MSLDHHILIYSVSELCWYRSDSFLGDEKARLSRLVSKCGLNPVAKVVDALLRDKEPQTLSNEYGNITMTKHQEKLSVCIYKGFTVRYYPDNT